MIYQLWQYRSLKLITVSAEIRGEVTCIEDQDDFKTANLYQYILIK